jgi:hypothetical protein
MEGLKNQNCRFLAENGSPESCKNRFEAKRILLDNSYNLF